MEFDTDNTHAGWEAQNGIEPQEHKTYAPVPSLKRMTDLLGVTMEELRDGGRERRLSDARALIAAALPITQQQMAALLDCSQPAVSAMRQRHKQLLVSDRHYRAKWEMLNAES